MRLCAFSALGVTQMPIDSAFKVSQCAKERFSCVLGKDEVSGSIPDSSSIKRDSNPWHKRLYTFAGEVACILSTPIPVPKLLFLLQLMGKKMALTFH